MPWCPNCKNEYREGITVCADCGTDLIIDWEERKMIPLLMLDQSAAQRLTEFMQYEGISHVETMETDEGRIQLSVPEAELKEALRLVQVFTTVEKERELAALTPEELAALQEKQEEEREEAQNRHAYVKVEDKYKENKASGQMFLAVGVLGLAFTVLNAVGVLSIFSGGFTLIIIAALFVAFVFIGISSLRHAKELEGQISTEEDKTAKIMEWMKANLTEEILSSADDPASTAEENDIFRYDYARKLLIEAWPGMDENYVDHLLDEYLE